MSSTTTTAPGTAGTQRVRALLAPLRQRWLAMSERERRIAGVVIALVLVVALWLLAVAPALKTVRTAPQRLEELDAQLQQMQRLAGETAQLRALPPVGSLQSQAALKAATDVLGPAGRLQLGGDRATVTFTNGTGTQLRDWLAEVRSTARVRPVEANLTRGAQGYSGTVIVQMPGSGSSP